MSVARLSYLQRVRAMPPLVEDLLVLGLFIVFPVVTVTASLILNRWLAG
jgi:hypothetical protein